MKAVITLARILSALFRPMYYPLVGFVILFTITYMEILPWGYKLWVLSATYLFTIGLPMMGIYLYRRVAGLSLFQLRYRHHRLWPYLISLMCYLCFLHLMHVMHLPHFLCGIILASLFIQGASLMVNLVWKVSLHSAGAGGIIGALVAYGDTFAFNPIWWLCGAIVLDGLVMTSRMILRQHSLWQALVGSLIGVIGGYLGVLLG